MLGSATRASFARRSGQANPGLPPGTAHAVLPGAPRPVRAHCGPMSLAKVGTLDLYYDEQGSGDPLLLIMGLAADSTAWMFQVPEFAKHYRTIVFDNRGVG